MFTYYAVTALLYVVEFSSAQQGQQEFFFGNAAQRSPFLQQQQAAPSAQSQQFSNFFQPINGGPFSPFRSQDISPNSQPQFQQSFQQTFPSQPTAFQLPPIQSSVPSSQNFNSFITSSRASPQAQQTFQPIKPSSTSFQPSSSFRQQKQQQSLPSVPSATRGEQRFQFSPFTSGEAQPPRSNFQNNVPVSTFQAPLAFSEVFQDDTPAKQQFHSFVNGQLQKDNIEDLVPQSRWRNTKTNADVDTNRLQRKPLPTSRTPSPPQSRLPAVSSSQDYENDSNSLGQQSSDYDEPPTFFKQAQTPINKQINFQRNKPVDLKKDLISPKTRFEVSTYRPQHQFIPRGSAEDEAEEELEDGEEDEEYFEEPAPVPVKPIQTLRSTTTETVRTDSRYRPTTYSPPSLSKARFINNQRQNNNIRQENFFKSQPEITTFRSTKPSKTVATNTITFDNSRNSTVIPITLKKQFKITGPLKNNSTFDVVVMNKENAFVTDDNFKGFVDSASIDVTEIPHVSAGEPNISDEESGGLQVSVEPSTTIRKDVPTTTPAPSFSTVTATSVSNKPVPTTTTQKQKVPTSVNPPDNAENPTSTESWVIVASVQTSRSVSGARFIPSGAVKQEELPKPLAPKSKENEDELEKTTTSRNSSSTESIIDKLDRVQSELSSGILTGGFNPSKTDELDMPEKTTTQPTTTSTTTTTIRTTTSSSEEEESPSTSRFVPSSKRFTTTSKPASKSSGKTLKESVQFDEELVGLLPPGFKPRTSTFTKKSTTTSTTTTSAPDTSSEAETTTVKLSPKSLLPKLKPKIKFEDVKAFVPAGYTPPPEEVETSSVKPALDSILSKVKFDDVSALLPPGFKPESSPTEKPSKSFPKIKFEEPSALLPKGFKPQGPPSKNVPSILEKAKPVDISAFLPPGFKPTEEDEATDDKVKKTSVSSVDEAQESSNTPTTTSSSKVVFPSRPGSPAATRKNSTSSASAPKGPGKGTFNSAPKIQKGWPTRATTEFMGWPSPPTSTISIEELLRAAKAAATSTEGVNSAAASSSTTTTTTTTTQAPTTPGYCTSDCELAATIKLVGGAKWVPELLDHNTKEWQTLANEVEEQLDAVYSSSASLNRWYKKIRIDAFSPGSVLVDYFVELSELGRTVSTADMKRLFHESLLQSTVNSEALTAQGSTQQADYSKLKLGSFDVDPKFTDFVVLQKRQVPAVAMAETDNLLPQWAIAVIVIGLASLLFVLIFGITVLVSRHKHSKKQPSPLTEDMLHELNKNHMGGHDNYGHEDLYNMEDVWNDKPMKKRGSTAYQDPNMPNMYDSWRSDWNGYYYNAYYGGAGGVSNHSGGYATRRRSDYDTNF